MGNQTCCREQINRQSFTQTQKTHEQIIQQRKNFLKVQQQQKSINRPNKNTQYYDNHFGIDYKQSQLRSQQNIRNTIARSQVCEDSVQNLSVAQSKVINKGDKIPAQQLLFNDFKMIQVCSLCGCQACNITTLCQHKFCKSCIEQALKIQNHCPSCRKYDPLQRAENQSDHNVFFPNWNVQLVRKILLQNKYGDEYTKSNKNADNPQQILQQIFR